MAKKQLTEEEIAQIVRGLMDTRSPKRRSAAKKLGKFHLYDLGEELLNAYLEERNDKRTWETQTEMIIALGKIGYLPALPFVREIVDRNKAKDMITCAAACTYVRLKRTGLQDAGPVVELLRFGKLSVLNGAAGVLAYDDMNPPEAELKVIIGLLDARSEEELSIRGLMDPREYLLSCLRNREDPTSREYVSRYIRSENRTLKECALLAQAGKKSRYE